MNRLTAILMATAALTAPSFAADYLMPSSAAPTMAAPASSWTGFYVGIFGGGAFNGSDAGTIEIDEDLDGDFDEDLLGLLGPAFGSNFIGSHDGGGLIGIEAGYDYQMDSFVIGGVADIAYVDFADRQSGFSNTPASYTETTELDLLATLRARAGYLVTESVLAYVHGGLAYGDAESTFQSTNINGSSRGDSDFGIGFQVGAGVEAKVTENISLGIEYAYTNLGGNDFTTRFDGGPAFLDVNPAGGDLRGSDDTFDFHTIKASVKYRF